MSDKKPTPKDIPPQTQERQPGRETQMTPRPQFKAPDYQAADKLAGKEALINGGDSGIGRAVALLFARERAEVANVYLAEIGGLTAGTGFDKYIVAGHLGLGGTLRLAWWDGFQGQAGQTFDLFDWGSAGGSFDIIDFGAATLAPGLQWDTGQLYTTGEIGITAVPEPGAGVLLLAGLAVLGWRARRAAANEGDRA